MQKPITERVLKETLYSTHCDQCETVLTTHIEECGIYRPKTIRKPVIVDTRYFEYGDAFGEEFEFCSMDCAIKHFKTDSYAYATTHDGISMTIPPDEFARYFGVDRPERMNNCNVNQGGITVMCVKCDTDVEAVMIKNGDSLCRVHANRQFKCKCGKTATHMDYIGSEHSQSFGDGSNFTKAYYCNEHYVVVGGRVGGTI